MNFLTSYTVNHCIKTKCWSIQNKIKALLCDAPPSSVQCQERNFLSVYQVVEFLLNLEYDKYSTLVLIVPIAPYVNTNCEQA